MTDALAAQAVAGVTSGMIVGLGTGRAAARGVRALAERVKSEKLAITCVATSLATTELAETLGLEVLDFMDVSKVDYLFDGADEVDPKLRMLKGGGGAMTRERIVAAATVASGGVRINMIDEAKLVPWLGSRMPLPVEVIPMALRSVRRQLEDMGLDGVVRQARDGAGDYRTDNGNLILDLKLTAELTAGGEADVLARDLNEMAGIVDHGLFVTESQTVLVEGKGGVRRLGRE
ncbi:MAG: ribose-5-phosphate isomerase RpiA [Phycisphaerales bacterium]